MSRLVESPTELAMLLKDKLRSKRGRKARGHDADISEKLNLLKAYRAVLSEYATTGISIKDLAVSNGLSPVVLTHIIDTASRLID